MTQYAVLTGDLVRSQHLPEGGLDLAFDGLIQAADALSELSHIPARLTRARGDGWQLLTHRMFALRAMFVCRAAVRACGKTFDTRIGLGVGAAEITSDTLSNAGGSAFVSSGQALDDMRKAQRFALHGGPEVLQVALPLADRISGGWTQRQAEIAQVALSRATPSQEAVATRLMTSQQNAQKIWQSAALNPIFDACLGYEALFPPAG